MTLAVVVVRRPVYLYDILPNDVCRTSTGKEALIITLMMA
jgi:hypothetical protein